MHQNKHFLTKVKNLGMSCVSEVKMNATWNTWGKQTKNEEGFKSWLIDENHNLQSEVLPYNAKIHLKNKTTR